MSDNTKIEWCDASWNPIVGCTPISEGCAHCYAQGMIRRFWKSWGLPSDKPGPVFRPEKLQQPYHWRKPRRIFVCSMSDLFHESVGFDWIDRVMAVVAGNTEHTFLLLTKRTHIMAEYMDQLVNGKRKVFDAAVYKNDGGYIDALCVADWMRADRPNLWLGATVENQKAAKRRVTELLPIPAFVRFLSIEPMLGPIYLGVEWSMALDWVILGAETGPNKRLMKNEWAHDVRRQCEAAGVPFFFKKDSQGRHTLDGKVYEQFPEVSHV